MKEYITPDLSIIKFTTDVITTSTPSEADDIGDTPITDFSW